MLSPLGRLFAAASLLTLLSASACGTIDDRQGEDDEGGPNMPPDPPKGSEPPDPDPYQAAPDVPPVSEGAISALASTVSGRLNSVGYTHSVRIDNVTTGQTLYTSNANTARIPASNTKLFTTAAAIDLLGADHGLGLRAYATGPVSGGVLSGDLVILGEHDFTGSSRMFAGARVPYDSLASQLRAEGLTSVSGSVQVNGEFVYEGNSVGYLNVGTQRDTARAQLTAALDAAGISHGSVVDAGTLEAPAGATLLAEHTPISMVAAASPINVPSHNEFADLLIRHIGWRIAGTSSYGAGNSEVLQWLNAIGVPTDGVGFGDGSGLSRDNKVSANTVLGLFEYMRSTPAGERWRRGMAISGIRGTIAGRMGGADTRGRVLGKTGTLSNVIALSGSLKNRYDGHEYVFSILFNSVGNQGTARSLSDQIVAAIAGNHYGIEGRLAAPDLHRVRAVGGAGILDISWDPVDNATGYIVWLSEDGASWDRADARFVEKTTFVAGELAASTPTFVRITAVDAAGFESDPSVVLSATASEALPTVLLVDANDRFQQAPPSTNIPRFHHDFIAALGHAAAGMPFDSASDEAVRSGLVRLEDYEVVVYAFGEEGSETTTLGPADQELVAEFVQTGGSVILSGSEILWDLVEQGDDIDKAFVSDILRVGYGGDDAGTHLAFLTGTADAPVSFQDLDTIAVAYPDLVVPQAGAEALYSYRQGAGGVAAAMASHEGGGKIVTMGFPIEAIPSDRDRKAVFENLYSAVAP